MKRKTENLELRQLLPNDVKTRLFDFDDVEILRQSVNLRELKVNLCGKRLLHSLGCKI